MTNLTIPIQIPLTKAGYEVFIAAKGLPSYRVEGDTIWTDELSYSAVFSTNPVSTITADDAHLFDYQRWVTNVALSKRRYAAFLDCGLGKTAIELAWAHRVAAERGRVLFLCPLAVMEDVQRFCDRFYGYRMSNLRNEPWKTDIAILNWESVRDIDGRFAGIVLDESSILKNGHGKTRKWLTQLASGCEYRLAASATPSPNEQAEYATHAVFLGVSSTLPEFYGQFFRKDGTRWRLKRHAVVPFYRHLRAWCCYIQRPSEVGFDDQQAEMREDPDYFVIETSAPRVLDQWLLFTTAVGMGEALKVFGMRADPKTDRFRDACASVEGKRAIVWAHRNAEEQAFHRALGGHLITGTTPVEERVDMLDDFRSGRVRTLVSKPSIMGFGVNIPEATDMLYSGYTWSFERFYQAVRRAHRFGRVGRLRVHVPVTDEERPIWRTLRDKMATFNADVSRLQSMMRGG